MLRPLRSAYPTSARTILDQCFSVRRPGLKTVAVPDLTNGHHIEMTTQTVWLNYNVSFYESNVAF